MSPSTMRHLLPLALLLGVAAACGSDPTGAGATTPGTDLPLGDLPDDIKNDGAWGSATTCKPIPKLPGLVHPTITISLDGLTLHLVDKSTGYDRVFPIGPGRIDTNPTSATFGESLSYQPLITTGGQDFTVRPAQANPCQIWWSDPEMGGAKKPVFAGLPFLSWFGNYGIHGPIDNFTAKNGGNLRRGFVSHGCIRMEAADILEVYARVRAVAVVPVHVQREAERGADGRRVDVASRWLGAECSADADCNFPGGVCHQNRYAERGFCTARCSGTCADRAGYPTSACVADPDRAGAGMCVPQVQPFNDSCRPEDHMVAAARPRFGRAGTVTACVPGSRGHVGDHCFTDGDCKAGNRCAGATSSLPGLCTQDCQRFCPDQPGTPSTFCATSDLGDTCLRACTLASNASECPGGTTCRAATNPTDGRTRTVCLPR